MRILHWCRSRTGELVESDRKWVKYPFITTTACTTPSLNTQQNWTGCSNRPQHWVPPLIRMVNQEYNLHSLSKVLQTGGSGIKVWRNILGYNLGLLSQAKHYFMSIVGYIHPSSHGYIQQTNAPMLKISNHLSLVCCTWQLDAVVQWPPQSQEPHPTELRCWGMKESRHVSLP